MLILLLAYFLLYAFLLWSRRHSLIPASTRPRWTLVWAVLTVVAGWRAIHWSQLLHEPTPLLTGISVGVLVLSALLLLVSALKTALQQVSLLSVPPLVMTAAVIFPLQAGIWADQTARDGTSPVDLLLLFTVVICGMLLALRSPRSQVVRPGPHLF